MKKFNSLFYLGLMLLSMPVIIFIIVAFASSRPANVQTPEVHKVVLIDVKPKEIVIDTIKKPEPVKPIKKKKIEVIDSIQPVIHLDTLIQKDTLH
jgi:hypothetical protein